MIVSGPVKIELKYSMQNTIIEQAWENRENLDMRIKDEVNYIISKIDSGEIRVAYKSATSWQVNEIAKKAILLSFRLNQNQLLESYAFDKVALKFQNWTEEQFVKSQIRAVPGSIVRYGAYLGQGVVLMPSFVNIGAYVGEGTMIDSYATVGSCAQIGSRCHISTNVGIGGVLEPIQAAPVIIEDDCFIGIGSQVVEGVIVEQGSVIGMGVMLGASTPIIDRASGEITYGRVPPYSVVIAGSRMLHQNKTDFPISLNCAIIAKSVDAKTRAKTSINELLRP